MAYAVKHNFNKYLDPNYNSDTITLEDINLNVGFGGKKIAYLLHNVFSERECQALIKKTEKLGYSPALVHHGDAGATHAKSFRDSERLMVDDKDFSATLFRRIVKLLPQSFCVNPLHQTVKPHQIKEINERLRFLRYDPGGKFKPHQDGSYARPDGSARSRVTLHLYLNEGFIGGETTFLKMCVGSDEDANKEENRVSVHPKAGSVLVFEHNILHEGSVLIEGRKYTVRMDVMYARQKNNTLL